MPALTMTFWSWTRICPTTQVSAAYQKVANRVDAALLVFANPATGDLIARVPEGADASIRKPFAMDELVSIVRGFALDFA